MAGENNRFLEIDTLKEMYYNELDSVSYSEDDVYSMAIVSLVLLPFNEHKQRQFVYVKLRMHLPRLYPHKPPTIEFANSRGLRQSDLDKLKTYLNDLAEEKAGQWMLYDLALSTQEYLTKLNILQERCVLCLDELHPKQHKGEPFKRTTCCHYAHTACILRHVESTIRAKEEFRRAYADMQSHLRHRRAIRLELTMRNPETKALCPACRTQLEFDVETLRAEVRVYQERAEREKGRGQGSDDPVPSVSPKV